MNAFQEVPAGKKSIANRRPLFGVGLNDANYMVTQLIGGKLFTCPYYKRWKDMLQRCYSKSFQRRRPAYVGCSTFNDWLTFSNFKIWMQDQSWFDMHLDKDIKLKGNKIYSDSTCLFIPAKLNTLLNDNRSARGVWPQGVRQLKRDGKFMARIRENGKLNYLGYFNTPEEASKVYQRARTAKIQSLIDNNTYPMATQYLSQHINQGSN